MSSIPRRKSASAQWDETAASFPAATSATTNALRADEASTAAQSAVDTMHDQYKRNQGTIASMLRDLEELQAVARTLGGDGGEEGGEGGGGEGETDGGTLGDGAAVGSTINTAIGKEWRDPYGPTERREASPSSLGGGVKVEPRGCEGVKPQPSASSRASAQQRRAAAATASAARAFTSGPLPTAPGVDYALLQRVFEEQEGRMLAEQRGGPPIDRALYGPTWYLNREYWRAWCRRHMHIWLPIVVIVYFNRNAIYFCYQIIFVGPEVPRPPTGG